jgi:sigma-54 dependent transcriptional regulator, flagellar regulatory protein
MDVQKMNKLSSSGFRTKREGASTMLIKRSDLAFVRAVGQLNYTNPFLEDRLELERIALGDEFVFESHAYWSYTLDQATQRRPNLIKISERAKSVAQTIRKKLIDGCAASSEELQLYDDLVVYILFYEELEDWGQKVANSTIDDSVNLKVWKRYSTEFDYWFRIPSRRFPSSEQKAHLFAMFYQVYRAFFNIFECVIGESLPAAQLRARIWQSIFTHDLRRFRRSLYNCLHQVTTLVTGPSGSGKELVARAIGTSRYIPFDPKAERFATHPLESYFAINISAFSKNLVESELFGHAKGAYTDAAGARAGWLETCGDHGSILLDEIGELDSTTQVKLLRVLQNRQYQRLGETKMREFSGKIIAATNRDLRKEIENGSFREDLYYRLCADVVETPTLQSQLQDNSDALENLVSYIAKRIVPTEHEALTAEVVQWLQKNLPNDYHWPGNIRELEQCVRNIMIHANWIPASAQSGTKSTAGETDPAKASAERLVTELQSLSLTADELICRYCKMAYQQTKSFEKSAKLLQLDRRTIRAKVDLVNEN